MKVRGLLAAAWVAVAGCVGGTGAGAVGARPAAAQESGGWSESLEARGETLPPAGFGTLEQDDITIPIEADDLLIKAVPLAERVIRMTAPDTWRRLHGYKVARAPEILQLARQAGESRWPRVIFVTFFTREVEASFQPHDLQVLTQNRTFRALGIVPVTGDFGGGRLRQQETQIALYLYASEIDLQLPMTVAYGPFESSRWNPIRGRLDAELSRVLSRAGAPEDREEIRETPPKGTPEGG